MPRPQGGVVGESIEEPLKAGPLNARVVIDSRTTDLPDEQQIAGDLDPPRRLVDHQVIEAVAGYMEELQD